MSKKKTQKQKVADNSSSHDSAGGKANSAAEYYLITFFEEKIVPYWRPLLWGLLVIILAVLLIFRFVATREAELTAAYSRLDAADSIEELEILAAEYKGQSISAMALLRKGNLLLQEEQKYEAAGAAFAEVASAFPAEEYRIPALLGQAYALEAQEKFNNALNVFQKIIEQAEVKLSVQTAAWSGIGRNALALNRTDEAHQAFSNVLDLVDNGPYVEQARELLRDIEIDAINLGG